MRKRSRQRNRRGQRRSRVVWVAGRTGVLAAAAIWPGVPARGQPVDLSAALDNAAALVTSPPAVPESGQVALNEAGLLDLHVRDIDIAALLELISYEARANIVTSTSVTGRVSANLYNVTLEQALEAVLRPNGYASHAVGSTLYVGKDEELAAVRPPPVTRVFKLRYMRLADAVAVARGLLGEEAEVSQAGGADADKNGGGGSTEAGKGSDMGPTGGDYLVVRARPDQLAELGRLLAAVDQRPAQVLVEATVLRATLNETNQYGIDFAALGGVDFRNVNSVSRASANLQTGLLPEAKFEETTFNVNTDFAGAVSDGGFTFGIIDNNIAAFLRALEEVTDVVVVANPKVVALNKQEGEVIVGRRDGYKTTTVTETAAVEKVEFLETGTQIRFRPVVNDDGTVRLIVHPKDSNGGLTSAQLPFEETTEAHADVLVKDGGTILIGGLFRERTLNSQQQIPGIGNIPGLGLLFGNKNDTTTREEVIILLTVHVLKDTPEEEAYYRNLLDDVERIRLGSRRGLLFTGRERLAQAYYHEAVRNLEEGRKGRALLNVWMTLNNQPKHLAALKLRDRLRGERHWDDDGTRMRVFMLELLDPQRGPNAVSEPVLGRPDVEVDLLRLLPGEAAELQAPAPGTPAAPAPPPGGPNP